MNTFEKLQALLCDHDGVVCIEVSIGDRLELQSALKEVLALQSWQESVLAEVGPEPVPPVESRYRTWSEYSTAVVEFRQEMNRRCNQSVLHLAAKLVEAREIMQPFAALLQGHMTQPDDRKWYGVNDAHVTLGDLRRLAAFAQSQPQPDHSEDKLDMVPQPLGGSES